MMKIAHFAIFDIYGGSDGAETILTSKYSGSTSSVSKMVDYGPPGAEKLIFSDKTSSSLIDCSPKLNSYYLVQPVNTLPIGSEGHDV